MLAGRKNLNSQTRPIGQDLKYLTPPCVPNLPFKSVYLPLTERKGSRPICFYIPPFFFLHSSDQNGKDQIWTSPCSQGAPCELITTFITTLTKLRKWWFIFYSSSFSTYLSRRWTFLTRCGESAATEVSRSEGAKEGPAPTEASRFSNGQLSASHWGLVLRIGFSTYDGHKREATQ